MNSISVLIVDEAPEVRAVLRMGLEGASDLRVVGEAGTCAQALRLAATLHPAAVLLCVSGRDPEALGAIAGLRDVTPGATIGALIPLEAAELRTRVLAAGADWWLDAETPVARLRSKLRATTTADDPDENEALPRPRRRFRPREREAATREP